MSDRKILKKYQPPLRIIRYCGRLSCDDKDGCPFSTGGHGLFCNHPFVTKNRGKGIYPKVPSVSFYGEPPIWCPLETYVNPNDCDGTWESCKKCNKKYNCEWSRI
jgi:hypothetical protein